MQTKGPHPGDLLQGRRALPIIEVFYEFNQLKQLYRQGWLHRGVPPERCESVAEHTFSMAILAMIIADRYYPELDRLKVLRMALLHDFGEIYAGDIVPTDGIDSAVKHQRELDAVRRVLGKLAHGDEYVALWQEYEDGATPEGRFVKQIDRLEMALQAVLYEQAGLVDAGQFIESATRAIADAPLIDILNALLLMRSTAG